MVDMENLVAGSCPETLMSPLAEIEQAYNEAMQDPSFLEEYYYLLKEYSGEQNYYYFRG